MAWTDRMTRAFRALRTALPGGEIAVSDTRQGVFRGPRVPYNPDELARKHGGLRIFDQMLEDEQIKACLALKRHAVLGPGWTLEPGDDSPAAHEFAETLLLELTALPHPFGSTLHEVLSALSYGFSVTEKVFTTDLALTDLKTRAPHGIDFESDEFGNLVSIRQMQSATWQSMPPAKFLHFTHQGLFGNHYGRSDLHEAYRAWWHKGNWLQWMAVWGEKLADQPVWFRHPPTAAQAKITATLNILENLQARSAIAVPEGWDINLLESERDVRAVFIAAIDRHDLAIARALLMPEKLGLAGGENQGGSFALSQTQFDAFLWVLHDLGEELRVCVQRQLIDQLTAFRAPTVPTPRFKLLPMTEDNKAQLATLWNQAVTAGTVVADVRDENHLRGLMGFPEVDETEAEMRTAILKKRAAAPPPPAQPPGAVESDDDEPSPDGEDDRNTMRDLVRAFRELDPAMIPPDLRAEYEALHALLA